MFVCLHACTLNMAIGSIFVAVRPLHRWYENVQVLYHVGGTGACPPGKISGF